MEQKNYTRESTYRVLLQRLPRAAKRNADSDPFPPKRTGLPVMIWIGTKIMTVNPGYEWKKTGNTIVFIFKYTPDFLR